jgi:hypothetical protein
MCYDEIELVCAQKQSGFDSNTNGKVYVIVQREQKHQDDLTETFICKFQSSRFAIAKFVRGVGSAHNIMGTNRTHKLA